MKIEKFIEQRIQRIISMVEYSTKKIVKKELKKMKRDLIKGVVKKNG